NTSNSSPENDSNQENDSSQESDSDQKMIRIKKIWFNLEVVYLSAQKMEIVSYVKQYGRNQVAKKFNLNASMIGRWVKASASCENQANTNSRKLGSGRRALYPKAEESLYTWIIEQRKQVLAVTYMTIQNQMKKILQQPNMILLYSDAAKTFKTSYR
ncbi:9670_t:CDS:2, partial [Gigaspora margarita]